MRGAIPYDAALGVPFRAGEVVDAGRNIATYLEPGTLTAVATSRMLCAILEGRPHLVPAPPHEMPGEIMHAYVADAAWYRERWPDARINDTPAPSPVGAVRKALLGTIDSRVRGVLCVDEGHAVGIIVVTEEEGDAPQHAAIDCIRASVMADLPGYSVQCEQMALPVNEALSSIRLYGSWWAYKRFGDH